jgi:hypothetical protein
LDTTVIRHLGGETTAGRQLPPTPSRAAVRIPVGGGEDPSDASSAERIRLNHRIVIPGIRADCPQRRKDAKYCKEVLCGSATLREIVRLIRNWTAGGGR